MSKDDNARVAAALPARVERALARARQSSAEGKRPDTSGRWLALVPIGVAVVMFLLLMPRATAPDDVPVPSVDERAVARVEAEDDARASAARARRLPTDVLAVGSAIRDFNEAQAANDKDAAMTSKIALDAAIGALRARPEGVADLLALRAVQMQDFLAEVARFEVTGEASKELAAVAGTFVPRLRDVGWIEGRRVLLTPSERRVAFKEMWNAETGFSGVPAFEPTLDEERALYTFYILHPHAPEHQRLEVEAQRRAARTEADCERAAAYERRVVELWRAEKVKALAKIDPSYPLMYALGVAYYRAGRYDLSVDAFRAWVDAHPDGPWAMRAQNHLRAALAAYGAP